MLLFPAFTFVLRKCTVSGYQHGIVLALAFSQTDSVWKVMRRGRERQEGRGFSITFKAPAGEGGGAPVQAAQVLRIVG